jgi:DNA-binding CsgD family transcriptional regulator
MTAPSTYLRQLYEAAARRRLEVAKLLRDNPAATNKQLAAALNVSRNTISLDRKIMIEDLKNQTLTETELLRQAMVSRLESLNTELELHRKDGKLSVNAVHEMLLVHRSIIELLGIRKPVTEQLEIKKRTISFHTTMVGGPNGAQDKGVCSLTTNHLALSEGSDEKR